MENTELLKGKYVICKDKILGTGGYATVYLGYVKGLPSKMIAIKTINIRRSSDINLICIDREISIMKSMNNINILKLYDNFIIGDYYFLVIEYCANGNLNEYINNNKLDINTKITLFRQILKGYNQLNMKNIIHRDIKLSNILLDENLNVKIADFGLSIIYNDKQLSDLKCGTIMYKSPELIKSESYTYKIDIWSLGVLLYFLLFDRYPFNSLYEDSIPDYIINNDIVFPFETQYDGIISDMLNKNDTLRIGISKLSKEMGQKINPITISQINYINDNIHIDKIIKQIEDVWYIDIKTDLDNNKFPSIESKQIYDIFNKNKMIIYKYYHRCFLMILYNNILMKVMDDKYGYKAQIEEENKIFMKYLQQSIQFT